MEENLHFHSTQQGGNPLWHVCFILFNVTKRGNPLCYVCLFLFDVKRRGNPLHHMYLTLFDMTRGETLPLASVLSHSMQWGGVSSPRQVYFLLNDPTPPSRNLCDRGLQLAPLSFK